MNILIFDMDGVLLEPKGYHQALKTTVRLAGEHLSLHDIELTQKQIHKFEALGISSEWHSSALCMAYLQIHFLSGIRSPALELEEFFCILEEQPLEQPAIERGLSTIEILCRTYGVDPKAVRSTITNCENIDLSLTMQLFQELVLGSESYQNRYKKPAMNDSQSYLHLYDLPILSTKNADSIKRWIATEDYGAAIMTNRPSSGPLGFSGSPEAELGLDLVHLSEIPLIGFGDISWLASKTQTLPGTIVKPNATHALAAILSSIHIEKNLSLQYAGIDPVQWPEEILQSLQGGTISVFEDTPAGLMSVKRAGNFLDRAGVDIKINAIGIAKEKSKKAALASQGAQIFPDINSALSNLENFGSLASN